MDKIIKLTSKQGTFNTTDKLLGDFTLPGGSTYNLRDSYLNVVMRVDSTDTKDMTSDESGESKACISVAIKDDELNNSNTKMPNVALIKNAHMSSQNKGKIDDIRRVDSLKTMLYNFEVDKTSQEDNSYYSLCGVKDENNKLLRSPFLLEEKEGTNTSQYKDHSVKIKLSEIFDICNEPLYNGDVMGDTDIHLEFNFDKLEVFQTLGKTDLYWNDVEPNCDNDGKRNEDVDDVALNSTGGNVNVNSLVASRTYDNDDFKMKSPFWVGQRLRVEGQFQDNDGSNPVNFDQSVIVSELSFDETTGKFTISFNSNIVQPNAKKIASITVKGNDIATSSITIPKVEMVLRVDESGETPPQSYTYYSYDTEIDNHNGRQNVKKNYMVDPNCQNVYITFGKDILSSISSGSGGVDTYRIAQNNVDLFGRSVQAKAPLHYDLVSSVYRNNQRVLKNITEHLHDRTNTNNNNFNQMQYIMFPTTENEMGNQSIVNLEMNTFSASHGISEIKIFQEKVKSI